ncbi:MAG: mobilization protein [Ruminococcus sp.]|nr:mobilization protein [Ruminococcus sp.]
MSEKRMDKKNRWRSKTVSFRMSPDEVVLLDKLVNMSGYSKQDYIIERLLQRNIVVTGNPRTFKALRNQLLDVHNELIRLKQMTEDNDELLCVISQIGTTLDGFKQE